MPCCASPSACTEQVDQLSFTTTTILPVTMMLVTSLTWRRTACRCLIVVTVPKLLVRAGPSGIMAVAGLMMPQLRAELQWLLLSFGCHQQVMLRRWQGRGLLFGTATATTQLQQVVVVRCVCQMTAQLALQAGGGWLLLVVVVLQWCAAAVPTSAAMPAVGRSPRVMTGLVWLSWLLEAVMDQCWSCPCSDLLQGASAAGKTGPWAMLTMSHVTAAAAQQHTAAAAGRSSSSSSSSPGSFCPSNCCQ